MSLHHIIREPTSTDADTEPLLVLLHGYGSDENDLMGLAPHVDSRFRVVSVRAPLLLEQGGYAWFPIELGPEGILVEFDDVAAALERLVDLIQELQKKHDASGGSTFLLGFSQGASMAVSAGLNHPDLVAGLASLSGVCVPEMIPPKEEAEALRDKPMFVSHGCFDQLIPISQGRASADLLKGLPLDLTYLEYDMGHEISQACLKDLTAWLEHSMEAQ